MELTAIRAHNYTGLRAKAIEIPKGSRALLIAGPNGAGKTALIDAIRYALAGTLPRGLKLKKELPEVITTGESDGSIGVSYLDPDGREHAINVKLKTGNATSPAPLTAIEAAVMSPQVLIGLEPSKRRKVLFDWAGISLSIEAVMSELKAGGHEDHHLARLTTSLKAGFEAGAKRAKELASESRGSWQATTGQNYGSAKAVDWTATAPTDFDDPAETKTALEVANTSVTRLTSIRDQLQQYEQQHVRAEDSRKKATGLAQARKDRDAAEERRAEQQTRLEALTAETQAESAGGWTAPCPCCKKVLKSSKAGELVEYVPASVDPATAIAAVNRARTKLGELIRDVQTYDAAVRAAEVAQQVIDTLPDRPTVEELAKANEDARVALEDQRIASSEHEAAVAAHALVAGAANKTALAKGYHEDAVAFAALDDAITALPAKFLDTALTAVNEKLAAASAPYGRPVQIGEDMELRYGTTRYGLLSRSQQWRAELSLGLALSNNGIVLMDEFDLVQITDRGPILQMLSEQTNAQVVLGATLKAAPQLPDDMPIHSVWLGKSE